MCTDAQHPERTSMLGYGHCPLGSTSLSSQGLQHAVAAAGSHCCKSMQPLVMRRVLTMEMQSASMQRLPHKATLVGQLQHRESRRRDLSQLTPFAHSSQCGTAQHAFRGGAAQTLHSTSPRVQLLSRIKRGTRQQDASTAGLNPNTSSA